MSETNSTQPTGKSNDGEAKQAGFMIQQIYIKNSSFEVVEPVAEFKEEWKPEVKFDLKSDAKKIDGEDNMHEVMLTLDIALASRLCTICFAHYFLLS